MSAAYITSMQLGTMLPAFVAAYFAASLGGYRGTRMLQDNCLWKPPGTKSLGMHQDGSYADYLSPPEMITCWVALDETFDAFEALKKAGKEKNVLIVSVEPGSPAERAGLRGVQQTGEGAMIIGDTEGVVKIIAERDADGRAGRILGVHLCGPWATEQLGQGYLAVNWEATVDEVAHFIQPHPTLSELFGESVLAMTGRSLHG